ncbi:MAG: tRNA 2-thiouridine(34) synthase MnmA [Anaerolineales bacterium]|jgi:tRNA-specific 2-thiouridylase
MNSSKKVVVAMSGGVDSSVTAALLKQQGYQVIGMMLRLWSEPGKEAVNRCCSPDDLTLARRIAAQLDIPFYAVDAKDVFYQDVVIPFIDAYAQGTTPNPCLNCNRSIRWQFLLDRALALGADYLATGHYARIRSHNDDIRLNSNTKFELLRGIDHSKDQSYVLHILNQAQLAHAMFPLGAYTKVQVREMAIDFGLPVAHRNDSQDLCFLGGSDYQSFMIRNAPQVVKPGPITNLDGEQIGQHQGLAFYTIGQRKGLGIQSTHPLYVIKKEISTNTLFVGVKGQLGKQDLIAGEVNWISGIAPEQPIGGTIKIRYKAEDTYGRITPQEDGSINIRFTRPLRDITPGQAAVIYDGEVCLGGGIIR